MADPTSVYDALVRLANLQEGTDNRLLRAHLAGAALAHPNAQTGTIADDVTTAVAIADALLAELSRG